ncbi:MAG: hypothetical protein WBM43_14300 [Flavobacteriaceae bacterium]
MKNICVLIDKEREMWFQIYKTMSEYYVEIFLGISIGAFVISIILLISFIKGNLEAEPVCKAYTEENDVRKMYNKQIGID